MTRASTLCILSGTLAAFALSATAAGAETITPHMTTPAVHIQTSHVTTGSGSTGGGAGKGTTATSGKNLQFGVGRGIKSGSGVRALNPQPLPP